MGDKMNATVKYTTRGRIDFRSFRQTISSQETQSIGLAVGIS